MKKQPEKKDVLKDLQKAKILFIKDMLDKSLVAMRDLVLAEAPLDGEYEQLRDMLHEYLEEWETVRD